LSALTSLSSQCGEAASFGPFVCGEATFGPAASNKMLKSSRPYCVTSCGVGQCSLLLSVCTHVCVCVDAQEHKQEVERLEKEVEIQRWAVSTANDHADQLTSQLTDHEVVAPVLHHPLVVPPVLHHPLPVEPIRQCMAIGLLAHLFHESGASIACITLWVSSVKTPSLHTILMSLRTIRIHTHTYSPTHNPYASPWTHRDVGCTGVYGGSMP